MLQKGGFLGIECNGNSLTKLLHLLVFHELHKMRIKKDPEIVSITPEKTVLLEKKGQERAGRFDFLVQAKDRIIGIEVLTRPSKGKLRQKLAYASEVDEFIFVLPETSLGLYRKKNLNGYKRLAPKNFLGKEFNNPKLKIWLVDCQHGRITEKGKFEKVFETE
jgi:hypothetical protein